jgi:hypothetical protein
LMFGTWGSKLLSELKYFLLLFNCLPSTARRALLTWHGFSHFRRCTCSLAQLSPCPILPNFGLYLSFP